MVQAKVSIRFTYALKCTLFRSWKDFVSFDSGLVYSNPSDSTPYFCVPQGFAPEHDSCMTLPNLYDDLKLTKPLLNWFWRVATRIPGGILGVMELPLLLPGVVTVCHCRPKSHYPRLVDMSRIIAMCDLIHIIRLKFKPQALTPVL